MANVVKLKRGTGSDPSASDMVVGEPVIRTDTAELFFKKDDGTVAKVSGGGGGPEFKYLALRNAANNGSASYPAADFTLVTDGTTTAVTPVAAATLLVSYAGVIQQPSTGTSTPSNGFALSGSTIKFSANIAAAPEFIIYQESGGIGEPSDNTVTSAKIVDGAIVNADINASAAIAYSKLANISANRVLGRSNAGAVEATQVQTGMIADNAITSAKIVDGAIVNADVNASAAIAGSKISPDFGSQDVTTTGIGYFKELFLSDVSPELRFTDSDHNPDYYIRLNSGMLKIRDITNAADRLVVNADGHVDILGNLDVGAGLDVTGNITVTGTVDGIDIATDVAANTAKVTNATHSGEVTGATSLTIADNVVDEANLKVSNSPSNGYFLSAQSGNTGGLTWAEVDLTSLNASNLTSGTVAEARLPASALGSTWESKTSSFTAEARKSYFVDTSSAAITATLPGSATIGDEIRFLDVSGTFDSNKLTVARNGHKIQGVSANLEVETERAGLALVYYNSTQGWLLKDK